MRQYTCYEDGFILSRNYDLLELNEFIESLKDLPEYIKQDIYNDLLEDARLNQINKDLNNFETRVYNATRDFYYQQYNHNEILDDINSIVEQEKNKLRGQYSFEIKTERDYIKIYITVTFGGKKYGKILTVSYN